LLKLFLLIFFNKFHDPSPFFYLPLILDLFGSYLLLLDHSILLLIVVEPGLFALDFFEIFFFSDIFVLNCFPDVALPLLLFDFCFFSFGFLPKLIFDPVLLDIFSVKGFLPLSFLLALLQLTKLSLDLIPLVL
jgi:hypothetical protein